MSFIRSIVLCVYFWLEAVYNFIIQFLSPRKKLLKDDIVVITGAASGIGRLLCIALASDCHSIIALDINEDGLEETKHQVYNSKGVIVYTYYCDTGNRESINQVAKTILENHGTVGLVVSNAGVIGSTRSVIHQSDGDFEKTFRINTFSHFWIARAFLPSMIANRKGHLAFVTSSAGSYGAPRLSDYCSSKAAATSLCETLDLELNLLGVCDFIHTTCIAPFLIDTDLFKGCMPRYPILTPCLDARLVVKRIISAILSNQKIVCIGRYVYLLNLLKSIVPVDGLMLLYEFSGALNIMDNYGI